MENVELWDSGTAGKKIKSKIVKESIVINLFVLLNTILLLLWISSVILPNIDNTDFSFCCSFLRILLRRSKFLLIIYKLSFGLASFTTTTVSYQLTYIIHHVKFQTYMFNKYVEELTSDFEGSDYMLIRDEDYQKEVSFRLKMLTRRHLEFLRWRSRMSGSVSHLIVPFSLGGCLIGFSIALSIYKVAENFQDLVWPTLLFLSYATVNFSILIIAGQSIETEVTIQHDLKLCCLK
jgi:hypothetical protein